MFLRRRKQKKNGQDYAYCQLVESYRTERGPRQRVVAHLGDLDEAGRIGVKEAAAGNSEHVRQTEPRWVEVDTSRVRVERTRFFGGAWLGLQILEKLGLVEFLESVMSLVLVLSRLCDPSSELRIAGAPLREERSWRSARGAGWKSERRPAVSFSGCAASSQVRVGKASERSAWRAIGSWNMTSCSMT